jgi:DNA-binding transcriptional LysR family regulator
VPSVRFTLRQLEYLLAAADAGSVTEAAQNIPVAQSSVSAAIAQLEAALGVQLLIRHHAQGISPTAEGRQFLERARELLRNADELERFASELTGELSGTLHLGCLVTVAPLMMPRLGKGFRERHPAVALEMVEAGQQELVSGVRSGRLSVSLTYDLDLAGDLAFSALASLPPYAVFAADHPLAGAESVSFAELAAEPLVLLDLPHSRDYFRGLFSAAGVEPRIEHRSVHPDVIRTMVANGFGYSIFNARTGTAAALDGMPLANVTIAGEPRPMILGLVRLASVRPTRLVAAFEQHCRAAIASGVVSGVEPLES